MSDQDDLCYICKHKKADHYSGISGCLVTACPCSKFVNYTWAQRVDEMPRAPVVDDDSPDPCQWSRDKINSEYVKLHRRHEIAVMIVISNMDTQKVWDRLRWEKRI